MISTRPYRPGADRAAFETLYAGYLAHYALGPANRGETDKLVALLDAGRHMSCLLAFDDAEPAGFATWALTFPADRSTALFMKELFVLDAHRGHGVGRHLLAGLAEIAEQEGCARMDWQTDGDNTGAQAFYHRIGAPLLDKRSFRVPGADLARFRQSLK